MKESSIFIFTNGRSTFGWSQLSLRVCCGDEFTVIRDRKLAPALNVCLDCGKPYFFKVDDDFFLHPRAISFMRYQLQFLPETGWSIFCCSLWDVFASRTLGNLKIYNVATIKSIGGFAPDNRGRVDGSIISASRRNRVQIIHDHSSIVALHVCGSEKDQELHRTLWRGHVKVPPEQAAAFYELTTMKRIFNRRIVKLEKLNAAKRSRFNQWLSNNPL